MLQVGGSRQIRVHYKPSMSKEPFHAQSKAEIVKIRCDLPASGIRSAEFRKCCLFVSFWPKPINGAIGTVAIVNGYRYRMLNGG